MILADSVEGAGIILRYFDCISGGTLPIAKTKEGVMLYLNHCVVMSTPGERFSIVSSAKVITDGQIMGSVMKTIIEGQYPHDSDFSTDYHPGVGTFDLQAPALMKKTTATGGTPIRCNPRGNK